MKRLVGVASLIHRDSALTGTKPGRDAMTQAIFPIRGKSINAETKAIDVLLDNEEVKAIINILGCGILEDYDEKKLKFDKIILLSDADVDGAHIRILLLTLFYRLMPDLVKNGHLYTIQPPLYRVYHDGVNKYFMTDKDVDEYIKKLKGKKFMKTRFKGLGECNPPDLAMVMNKDQRTLIQLTLKDCEEFEEMLSGLMGRDTDFKKDMLNSI